MAKSSPRYLGAKVKFADIWRIKENRKFNGTIGIVTKYRSGKYYIVFETGDAGWFYTLELDVWACAGLVERLT